MPNPQQLTRTEHKQIIHRIVYKLSAKGMSQQDIADVTGYTQGNISHILRKIGCRGGLAAYEVLAPPGAECQLDQNQLQDLGELLGRGAKEQGFPDNRWSRSRVRQLISHLYGVNYSTDYVGELLAKLDFTLQKVVTTDNRRQRADVRRYEREVLPVLKKN